MALEIEVPDDVLVSEVDPAKLPRGWSRAVRSPECEDVGEAWLEEGSSAVLLVSSALVPEERNALINPGHSQALRMRTIAERRFTFDPRLLE